MPTSYSVFGSLTWQYLLEKPLCELYNNRIQKNGDSLSQKAYQWRRSRYRGEDKIRLPVLKDEISQNDFSFPRFSFPILTVGDKGTGRLALIHLPDSEDKKNAETNPIEVEKRDEIAKQLYRKIDPEGKSEPPHLRWIEADPDHPFKETSWALPAWIFIGLMRYKQEYSHRDLKVCATGSWDSGGERFKPVKKASFPAKLKLAGEWGFEHIIVPRGQCYDGRELQGEEEVQGITVHVMTSNKPDDLDLAASMHLVCFPESDVIWRTRTIEGWNAMPGKGTAETSSPPVFSVNCCDTVEQTAWWINTAGKESEATALDDEHSICCSTLIHGLSGNASAKIFLASTYELALENGIAVDASDTAACDKALDSARRDAAVRVLVFHCRDATTAIKTTRGMAVRANAAALSLTCPGAASEKTTGNAESVIALLKIHCGDGNILRDIRDNTYKETWLTVLKKLAVDFVAPGALLHHFIMGFDLAKPFHEHLLHWLRSISVPGLVAMLERNPSVIPHMSSGGHPLIIAALTLLENNEATREDVNILAKKLNFTSFPDVAKFPFPAVIRWAGRVSLSALKKRFPMPTTVASPSRAWCAWLANPHATKEILRQMELLNFPLLDLSFPWDSDIAKKGCATEIQTPMGVGKAGIRRF